MLKRLLNEKLSNLVSAFALGYHQRVVFSVCTLEKELIPAVWTVYLIFVIIGVLVLGQSCLSIKGGVRIKSIKKFLRRYKLVQGH